jgi:Tfp pilus assembly protein PilO
VAANKAEKLSGNNLMIVLLLITFLVVGASVLIVKALVGSIALDVKVVSAKSKADKQLTQDVTAAPMLVDSYSALGAQAQTLSDALPNDSDFPGLIVTLENMSNSVGIKLKSVAPVTAVTVTVPTTTPVASADSTPTPQTYPFSITFDGTYTAVKNLLALVETSARPMRVVGLQLTGSGSNMSGEIDMQTFYQDKGQLPFSTETIK